MSKLRRMIDDKKQCLHFVFLHGWGQSSRVWHQQQHSFHACSHWLNLPGHGGAQDLNSRQWLEHLETQITNLTQHQPVVIIGWSLGGQLALALQQRANIQQHLAGLVLVSTTPAFRQQPDWFHGCSDEVWQGFSEAAAQQDSKLMQRFFQMMLHGDVLTRSERNSIAKEALNKREPATFEALQQGLELLSSLDLRQELQQIDTPTLVIHGQQDVIVPVEAGLYLAEHLPHSTSHIFQECGHAPFLTHHAKFNQLLEQWCKTLSV